jgi:hypothetical protein
MQAINRPVFRDVMQDVFQFSVERIFSNGEPGVWYDLSDLNTLFQDRAGTVPVTAIGQTIGRILDKSGRGNHLTANSDAARGLYQADVSGRPFVLFDGINDCYVTPTITPGTDKAQVFAGVRKLADTNINILEMSASIASNNGALRLSTATQYTFSSKGTVLAAAATTGNNTAPTTNVLTGLGDISGDSAIMRNGGVVQTTTTTDQGTGNYLAYPMYVG